MKRIKRVAIRPLIKGKSQSRRQGNVFNKVIYVQVTNEVHGLVKKVASDRNISIRQWLTRSIVKSLKDEFRSI